jgi:arylsulfatase
LVDIDDARAEGVLFAHGSRFGGHSLYLREGRLNYVNNFVGITEQKISASENVPAGANQILSAAFEKDGEEAPGIATGVLSLYYGDHKVGEGRIKLQPGNFSLVGEGLTVGRAVGEPVTDDFPGAEPWPFHGGTIKRVAVDVSGEPYLDLERAASAMLARE